MLKITSFIAVFMASVISAAFAAEEWVRVSDEAMTNLHACGRSVVAWHGHKVSASLDGGRTWLPSHNPLADFGEGVGSIRTVQAAPDGGVWLLTSTGKILMAPANEGWSDWTRDNRLSGITSLTVSADGTVWVVLGMNGGIRTVHNGVLDPKSGASGVPLMTLKDGLVTINGDRLQAVTGTGISGLTFSGRWEDLPKPQEMARTTTPMSGDAHTHDGRHYVVENGMLIASDKLASAQIINAAEADGVRYLLANVEGRITAMEEQRGNWGRLTDARRAEMPAGATAFTVTSDAYVVTTRGGIFIIDRKRFDR